MSAEEKRDFIHSRLHIANESALNEFVAPKVTHKESGLK